jgi:hypothetical protein
MSDATLFSLVVAMADLAGFLGGRNFERRRG